MLKKVGCFPFSVMHLRTNIILEKPKNYKNKKEEL